MEGSSWEQIVEGQDWNPTKCYPYDHNRCQTTYGGPYEWNTFSNNTDKTREVWLFKCSVGPRWWESHNYDYDWIGCYFADSVEQYKDEFGAAIAAGHQAFIQLARGATFGGKATSHPQPVIVEYLSRGKRDE